LESAVGERWTMAERRREGSAAMRGMWKTFAERLEGSHGQRVGSR
jgi:hypothetical protein